MSARAHIKLAATDCAETDPD